MVVATKPEVEALEVICAAIDKVADIDSEITMDTDLRGDDVLDSLDRFSFLYELEQLLDRKLEEIDDDYDDFRISSLVRIITESNHHPR